MIDFFLWLESIPTWGFMLFMVAFFFVMLISTIIIIGAFNKLFSKQKNIPPFIETDRRDQWDYR